MRRNFGGILAGATGDDFTAAELPSCVLKTLPPHLAYDAAITACEANPANMPALHSLPSALADMLLAEPGFIAVLTGKVWPSSGVKLSVQFLDGPDTETRRLILEHMNAWSAFANVAFAETSQSGQVRIARANSGYWSFLGTDILHVSGATMNLQGFTAKTPLSEYKRVVRHETGHTLGCPHEHQRAAIVALLDPAKVYAYFGGPPNNWSKSQIDQQILTPLSEATLMGTPADVQSIMAYQFAGTLTKSGQPVPGGLDIDPNDGAYMGKIYPKAGGPVDPPPSAKRLVIEFSGDYKIVPA